MKGNMLPLFVIISVIVGTITVVAVGNASPMPVISVDPPIIVAEVGETFTVDITVTGITEEESLYGWEVGMSFNDPKNDTWTGDNVTKSFVTTEKPVLYESEKVYVNQSFMPKVTEETDTWTGDGTQTIFHTTVKPIEESKEVLVNGTEMRKYVDYNIDYTTGAINFTIAPDVGAEIKVTYEYAQYTIGYPTGAITFRTAPGIGAEIKAIYLTSPILEVLSVMEGPFLKSAGSTSWKMFPPKIDNNRGNVSAADALFPYPAIGAVGSGTLANITFQVKAGGTTNLHFYKTLLSSYDETLPPQERTPPIDHVAEDGVFARGQLVHDIAIIDVTPSSTSVPAGELVSINATVKNEGSATETFAVTVYYNLTATEWVVIGTINVTDLASGDSKTLSFSWDTKDVAEGNYTITAVASGIDGETDTADNTYTNVVVTVTASLPGFPTPLFVAIIVAGATMFSVVLLYMRRRRSAKA